MGIFKLIISICNYREGVTTHNAPNLKPKVTLKMSKSIINKVAIVLSTVKIIYIILAILIFKRCTFHFFV